MLKKYSLPILVGLVISVSAMASPNCKLESNQNIINYKTTAESLIVVEKAQITVRLDATLKSSSSAKVQQGAIDKLQKISPNSKWTVESYNQNNTSSGLLNISITFKTHLNSTQVAKLTSLIKSLNNSGERYSISHINYEPELQNIEQTKNKLRISMLGDIKQQINKLNQSESSNYTLKEVTFSAQNSSLPINAPRVMNYMAKTNDASGSGGALKVSQKVIMMADVELSENNKK